MDVTITTSAATDIEAYALLAAIGLPFSSQGRPKGYDPEADEAAARAHQEAQDAKAAAVAQPEIAPQPEPEAEPEAEAVAEPEPEAVAEPEAEAVAEPEAEAVAEPAAGGYDDGAADEQNTASPPEGEKESAD